MLPRVCSVDEQPRRPSEACPQPPLGFHEGLGVRAHGSQTSTWSGSAARYQGVEKVLTDGSTLLKTTTERFDDLKENGPSVCSTRASHIVRISEILVQALKTCGL